MSSDPRRPSIHAEGLSNPARHLRNLRRNNLSTFTWRVDTAGLSAADVPVARSSVELGLLADERPRTLASLHQPLIPKRRQRACCRGPRDAPFRGQLALRRNLHAWRQGSAHDLVAVVVRDLEILRKHLLQLRHGLLRWLIP